MAWLPFQKLYLLVGGGGWVGVMAIFCPATSNKFFVILVANITLGQFKTNMDPRLSFSFTHQKTK